MGSKGSVWLLWFGAIVSIVVVTTQSAARSWLAVSWVIACAVLAVLASVLYQIERKRRRRREAGNYE